MLLADLGADVIKVEHPSRGDDTRAWNPPSAPLIDLPPTPPPSPGSSGLTLRSDDWSQLPPESTYFLSVNRSKRSVGINLENKEGLKIVHELIAKADILVENYVPGKLEELGLGYETCKEINPKLIYASITGYGQSGPYSKNPGYDVNIEAEAGLMHITGEADGPPVTGENPARHIWADADTSTRFILVGVAITDLTTGLYAHGAIMAALLSRAETGKGVWIDCNLFQSQVASLVSLASSYLIAGKEATRQGTSHPSIVPYQNFPTKDGGWLMIGTGNDIQFKKFSLVLGQSWHTNSLYSSNALLVANRDALISEIIVVLSQHTTEEWLVKFKGQGFPHAPVNDLKGTFSHPQAEYRGVVEEVEHPRAGKIKLLAPAVEYNGHKMKITSPPPILGQHTVEVLREELGYSDETIAALQQNGTV